MKTLALAALAAGMLVSTIGTAPAQYYDPGYRDYPRYRDYPQYPDYPRYRGYDGPRPYQRELYYDERRSFGGQGYYRPGRYRTWNGCQPGWTVQDGLCKPYRGY
jgi:hypothetical protein